MRCPHCNSKLNAKNKFCPECGLTIVRENEVATKESGTIRHRTLLMVVLVFAVVVLATATTFLFNRMNYYKSLAAVHEMVTQEKAEPELSFPDDPEAIAQATKSVVKLNCYDRSGELVTTGSGFACFADNVVVTVHDLIADDVYRVEAYEENGRMFEIANVLAADAEKNVVILTAAGPHGIALLQPGDVDALQKEEAVVAIGCPMEQGEQAAKCTFGGYMVHNGVNTLHFSGTASRISCGGALLDDEGNAVGMTYTADDDGQSLKLAVPMETVKELYSTRREPITMEEWYKQHTPGYEDFLNSTVVKFSELLSNPKKYNGQLISVEGYVAEAGEQSKASNGNVSNWLYLLPSQSNKTWSDEPSFMTTSHGPVLSGYAWYWVEKDFKYSQMIRCSDLTHSIDMVEYIDDYVYVTGIFEYDRESASIDVRYVGQE